MIRFDKFTQKAQEAVQQAQVIAGESNHQHIAPLHLLIASVEQTDGIVQAVLSKLGVQPGGIAKEARRQLESLPQVSGPESQGGMYMAPALNEVFAQAQKEADQFKDEYVSTEHLLLAILVAKNTTRLESCWRKPERLPR